MLVLAAKNDAIILENEVRSTANKYNADFKVIDHIAHDMMLDINQEIVSEEIINWIERKHPTP